MQRHTQRVQVRNADWASWTKCVSLRVPRPSGYVGHRLRQSGQWQACPVRNLPYVRVATRRLNDPAINLEITVL